jgi:hypothetical protein
MIMQNEIQGIILTILWKNVGKSGNCLGLGFSRQNSYQELSCSTMDMYCVVIPAYFHPIHFRFIKLENGII